MPQISKRDAARISAWSIAVATVLVVWAEMVWVLHE